MFQNSCFSLCFFSVVIGTWSLHSHIARAHFDVCGSKTHKTLARTWFTHSSTIFEHKFLAAVFFYHTIVHLCALEWKKEWFFSIYLPFQTFPQNTSCAFYQMSIGMINLYAWIFDFFCGDHFGIFVSLFCSCNYLTKYILSVCCLFEPNTAISIINYAFTLRIYKCQTERWVCVPGQCALISIIK